MSKTAKIIIGVIVLAIIVYAVYSYTKKKKASAAITQPAAKPPVSGVSSPAANTPGTAPTA